MDCHILTFLSHEWVDISHLQQKIPHCKKDLLFEDLNLLVYHELIDFELHADPLQIRYRLRHQKSVLQNIFEGQLFFKETPADPHKFLCHTKYGDFLKLPLSSGFHFSTITNIDRYKCVDISMNGFRYMGFLHRGIYESLGCRKSNSFFLQIIREFETPLESIIESALNVIGK